MSLQSDYYKTAILQLKRGNYNGHVSNAKTYYYYQSLRELIRGFWLIIKLSLMMNQRSFMKLNVLLTKMWSLLL